MRAKRVNGHPGVRRVAPLARLVARISDALGTASELFCQVAVTAMCGLVLLQVVLRYVFAAPLPWAEEASVFLMVWIAFVGAGIAVRRGAHVAMTLLVQRMPAPLARPAVYASQLGALGFLAVLAWNGWWLALSASAQRSPGLGLPMMWPYLAIPIGCCVMLIEILRMLLHAGPPTAEAGEAAT